MGEVISIFRKKSDRASNVIPIFSAHFSKDASEEWVVNVEFVPSWLEKSEAVNLRYVADAMEDMARMIRDHAEAKEPSDDGVVMAFARVMENSRVRVWTSNKVETPEQVKWLHARFDDAKFIVTAES